ncbi:DUF2868 domain-containing protein [Candidimonas sp. SYP-B2681]|uniref:DUF2868 domain-containing protein n=1 Tax=Candidimonas sp. SYP-B2681 TaxID=2497686 RepID=UPI000F86B547|nr:DUF2868 domain-containing protein [Candidimonas sp. SYP-B2681]RTZ43305.1 DUF2868 domain-containing protein [Candidimonas sp. SYP-B2681]
MPEAQAQASLGQPRFNRYWLAETLRLREALWGPLEDANEVRRARAEAQSFPEKILLRADYLGRREKIDQLIAKWTQLSKVALLAMWLLSVLAGAATALGALGDGSRSVNVLLALVAMLGLNGLAFLFWLLSFTITSTTTGTWLGEAWLWLTRRLARGPDAALVPRALVEVLGRNNALRWILGTVSHGLWSTALLSMLLTLLGILSARRYGFNWETTLLSADTFVSLTASLGWLPALLGFAIPPESVVRASNGLQALPESAQALWSSWLIGCVVAYGLLPRLICLVLGLVMARKNLTAIGLDESLPGYAELRHRLAPASQKAGIDAPATAAFQAQLHPRPHTSYDVDQPLLVGIELPPDTDWPPANLPSTVVDLGIIDTRPQRKSLLDRLQQQSPRQLLMVCDAQQTPDRGTVALLADLASLAGEAHIVVQGQSPANIAQDTRSAAWHDRLRAAGFSAEQLHITLSAGLAWLTAAQPGDSLSREPHAQT